MGSRSFTDTASAINPRSWETEDQRLLNLHHLPTQGGSDIREKRTNSRQGRKPKNQGHLFSLMMLRREDATLRRGDQYHILPPWGRRSILTISGPALHSSLPQRSGEFADRLWKGQGWTGWNRLSFHFLHRRAPTGPQRRRQSESAPLRSGALQPWRELSQGTGAGVSR